jgi:hypothetical protein
MVLLADGDGIAMPFPFVKALSWELQRVGRATIVASYLVWCFFVHQLQVRCCGGAFVGVILSEASYASMVASTPET